jgi:fructokinase
MTQRMADHPTRSPVVVIGESLMDIVSSPAGAAEHPGGSPLNVSVGLARLAWPVRLLTRIGSDARGRRIAHYVESAGADLLPGSLVTAPTSTATAVLDGAGSARYEFAIEWSIDPSIALPDAPIVHTGSIAAFLEPGASQVAALLRSASAETIISFDPNIRPSIIGSRDNALTVVEGLAALATVVKLSDEDAAWLYGELSADEVVGRLLSIGATLAIVTLGASGALLATAQQRVSVPGRAVEVADTIGAGDSFMSAVIAGIATLLEGGTEAGAIVDGTALTRAALVAIGEFAVECAAITVSRPGANPPTALEMRR